jgi:probable phosphoglycerate mutase
MRKIEPEAFTEPGTSWRSSEVQGVPWPFERVVVVRHGETEWNRLGRRQGQLDSPLTSEGERHARAVASLVASTAVDSIFSSRLGRAHRSALIIAAEVGRPVRALEALAEVHHGAFAGLTNQQIEARHPGELLRRETKKYTWRFPDGESYADAYIRACTALDHVVRAGAVAPLLVTHEMIGRMLLRALLGLQPDQALSWSLPHGVVAEVSPVDGTVTETRTASSSPRCP